MSPETFRQWALAALAPMLLMVFPAAAAAQQREDLYLRAEGRSYHVWYARNEIPGPTLVLESGIAARIGHWDTILFELAQVATVFAYERPGVGDSPEDPEYGPQPEMVARSLRALLRAADLPPPYVLVGHSLGGLYAKAFADLHPRETAGIVLIDPTDFNESWSAWRRLYEEMGVGERGRRAFDAELDRLYDMEPPAIEREWQVVKTLRRASFGQWRSLDVLRRIPVRVLLGVRITAKPEPMQLPTWFSFGDFQKILLEHRHRNFWRWIEELPDCRIVITTGSGHFIHQEQPDLVVREISELVIRSRNQARPGG